MTKENNVKFYKGYKIVGNNEVQKIYKNYKLIATISGSVICAKNFILDLIKYGNEQLSRKM